MPRRLLVVTALLCVLAAACAQDDDADSDAAQPTTTSTPATTVAPAPECTVETDTSLERLDLTDSTGAARYALVHLPAGWDGKTPAPLVLAFHGASSSAEQQSTSGGLVEKADAEGFVIAFPNAGTSMGGGYLWAFDDNETAFVAMVLDTLTEQLCVDEARIYATGISNGGGMTLHTACALADRIAAAAAVSSMLPPVLDECEPSRPVPTIAFHGVEDQLLPYNGGGGPAQQRPFEEWGAEYAADAGCTGGPTETQYVPTVEALSWTGCDAPVVLYRVHGNGHTWPGHSLGIDRDVLVGALSGANGGEPNPVMVALGLTPEAMADSITLTNTDIDATDMLWDFFEEHTLDESRAEGVAGA